MSRKKPEEITGFNKLCEEFYKVYKELPRKFDESLTILEKLNRIIYYMHKQHYFTGEMLKKWNEVYGWVLNEGLVEAVEDILDEWLENGTLEDLINDRILEDIKKLVEGNSQSIEELKISVEGNSQTIEELKISMEEMKKYVTSEIERLIEKVDDVIQTRFKKEHIVINVGQGEEYEKINDVLEKFENEFFARKSLTINLTKDYVLNEQIFIEDKNYFDVSIESDHTIYFNESDLVKNVNVFNYSSNKTYYPIFYGKNSWMPKMRCLFENRNKTKRDTVGMVLIDSQILLKNGSGFRGMSHSGMVTVNSSVLANSCHFDNNGNREDLSESTVETGGEIGNGILSWSSNITSMDSTANNVGDTGFNINNSSTALLNGVQANNNGHHGIMASGASQVTCRKAEVKGTLDDGIVSYAGSHIDARGSDASNTKVNYGVIATRHSTILFQDGKANNTGKGIMANRGSIVDCTGATINNSNMNNLSATHESQIIATNTSVDGAKNDNGHCTHGGSITARESTFKNAGRNGVHCYLATFNGNNIDISGSKENGVFATRGSDVNVAYGSIRNVNNFGIVSYASNVNISHGSISNTGNRGIEATQGSYITAHKLSISGVSGGNYDVHVYNGSIVSASESNVKGNIDKNTITDKGILFG